MTYAQLFEKLRTADMSEKEFRMYVKNIGGLYADVDSEIELLNGAGAPLFKEINGDEVRFSLSTHKKMWEESNLIFVDIETNGAKPQSSEIIEIGAIKTRGGKIIESFESYIYAPFVPENITELTGITYDHIANAPCKEQVLKQFKAFLGYSVFVAHNVNFDYGFLDYHLRQCGFFGLLNPKLCTIELAKKVIPSKRYALAYLNDFLSIHTPVSHRAYADALTSLKIFNIATMMFPPSVRSIQDLIDFSKGRVGYK